MGTIKDMLQQGHAQRLQMIFGIFAADAKSSGPQPFTVEARKKQINELLQVANLMQAVPSDSWLRNMVVSKIQECVPFMESCLASVDAGRAGVVRFDHTFAVMK